MHLARRALSISGSATLELTARVAELRARGVDVVSLGAGEPDFPTPPAAIAAAQEFIGRGRVLYTAGSGLPELREAAAAELSRVTGVRYEPAQVIVTCGAKEGIALAILALTQAGDEVLLPTPAWISYEPMAQISEARVRTLPCDDATGFKLTPETLAAALTPAARVLVLNSPNNPTGAVYTRAELAALCRVLQDSQVVIVSDEIYSPFVYEGEHVSPASLPGWAERTVVVNGVSKSHSMTGWRIGYVGAPLAIAQAIGNLKSHLTSNAAGPSQVAALAALRGGDAYSRMMQQAFARRRAIALEAIAALPGVRLAPPAGAFYVFPRVDAFYGAGSGSGAAAGAGPGGVRNSNDFCRGLLEQARVAALPGSCFGEDRCIRFSIATADDQLREGLSRFGAYLQTLAPAGVAGASSWRASAAAVAPSPAATAPSAAPAPSARPR